MMSTGGMAQPELNGHTVHWNAMGCRLYQGGVGSGRARVIRAFHLSPFWVRPKDLSRLRIILNHFELEYLNPMVLSTDGQLPTPCWVQFVNSFWMFCICAALISVVTFMCPWSHYPSDLPSAILHVRFESIWVILPVETCHFTCSFWVVLSHFPRAKTSSWIA